MSKWTKRDDEIPLRIDSSEWTMWPIPKGSTVEDAVREVAVTCGVRHPRYVCVVVDGVEKKYEVRVRVEVREV